MPNQRSGNYGKGKNKNGKFGLSTKQHVDILVKLKGIDSIANKELFESKLLVLKVELLQYIQKDLIPSEQTSLLVAVFSRACLSTDESILSMLSSFVQSSLIKQQLSVHLLTWTTTKDSTFCKLITIFCMDIFENCLRLYPRSILNVSFNEFANFVKYLNCNVSTARLQRLLCSHYKVLRGLGVKLSNLPVTSRATSTYTSFMPNDDFRRLSTIPSAVDLLTTDPIPLQPIISEGSYPSGEMYLDTHYRLIREDLLSPLRRGIQELVRKEERKINLTVFSGVKVLYPVCTFGGVVYKVCFNTGSFNGFQWEHSKKLIFGSLLCFTCDNFRTMIFGTVASHSPECLRYGMLDVRFESSKYVQEYCSGKLLCMVESPSFFEAYRHVMDCLKEINPYLLPMRRYILACSADLKPPQYLINAPGALYDLSGAIGVDSKATRNVPVLKMANCKKYTTDLNPSQLTALIHALQNEFALIQGPPGTGKTFCGLRIAHCLLTNKKVWNPSGQTPMLIICYTNHALDQFLQGLLAFGHRKLIRVGGRASEEMEPYSMATARTKFRRRCTKNNTHNSLRYKRYVTSETRDQFASDLGPYMVSVKKYQNAIHRGKLVLYTDIKHCMDKRHGRFFADQDQHCVDLSISVFDIFLELCKIPIAILKNVSRLNSAHDTSAQEPTDNCRYLHHHQRKPEEEVVDVFDEGKALVDRWVIDQDEFTPITPTMDVPVNNEQNDDGAVFIDNDGFRLVTIPKRDKERKVRTQLQSVNAMMADEVKKVNNPWELGISERWRLYKYWLGIFMKNYDDFIELKIQQYEDACEEAKRVRLQEDETILKSVDVIAMTTTCAGRYRHVLRNIKPKVVIIEEAAEVLEAHVVGSLIKETEHCILIGDHKQLRPNPQVHELARDYNLDLSLFERMVRNGIKCITLNVQHRMRPQISCLVRHIYPQLNDHDSVTTYDNIRGVSKNMYFINHTESEKRVAKLSSKSNQYEAKFVKSLCLYFLQQGYTPNQITILTTYSAQLMEMRSVMPKAVFEGVRVTTVDNFQGEENDIILLSLVRSNDKGSIGFLKTENRICVALSRAKKGLYVIGNFTLLGQESDIWMNIITDVKAVGCFDDHLTLICQKHPFVFNAVSSADDFQRSPEGGCQKPCDFRLSCGHSCQLFCHSYDPNHDNYICEEQCLMPLCDDRSHYCDLKCHYGRNCDPCSVPVEKLFPKCGHIQLVPCSLHPSETSCQWPCEKSVECGHKCSNKCGEECSTSKECVTDVEKSFNCGHLQTIECNRPVTDALCKQECKEQLLCGHICQGTCGECDEGEYHLKCKLPCEFNGSCFHRCHHDCSQSCSPCPRQCVFKCIHESCTKTCGSPCIPCAQPCVRGCKHKKCTNLCGEICNVKPCFEPCKEVLACGHECVGFCGEVCPTICGVCDDQSLGKRFVLLDCCQSIIAAGALETLLKVYTERQPYPVAFVKCPACSSILLSERCRKQIIEVRADLRRIFHFVQAKDKERMNAILSSSFLTCRHIAQYQLQSGDVCNVRDCKLILSQKCLRDFKENLNLRYLARNKTKSGVLLLAERLVQCHLLADSYRLSNQISILHLVTVLLSEIKSHGALDGQSKHLNLSLDDVSNKVMDATLSVHQASDLLLLVNRISLRLQLILCRRFVKKSSSINQDKIIADIKSMLKSLNKASPFNNTLMMEMIGEIEGLKGQLNWVYAPGFPKPTLLGVGGHPVKRWFKCSSSHLFYAGDDDTRCPKCSVSVSSSPDEISLCASDESFQTLAGSDSGIDFKNEKGTTENCKLSQLLEKVSLAGIW